MGFTTRVKSEASEKKPFNFALFWDKYGTFFILAIIVAIFGSLSSEYFLTTNNITQIFVQSSVTVLIGMGEFFAILVAGIDLSVGAILALSGMVTAKLMLAGIDPFLAALIGGIWLLWWMGFHLSVATGTGFIALAGVAAEFGVVMLMYLRHAIEAEPLLNNPQTFSEQKLDEALYHGAVLRVRPKAMTVAVIIAGLLPILWGTGAGSEVMSRIAAPMIGGMITAPLLSLFIIPAAYKLMWLHRHRVRK